ncbi:MAG: RodZ domain-containing protein [Elusimicrobiota bacterium]
MSGPSETEQSGVPANDSAHIFEAFRARRLERGLTLEKVREDTKITVKFILALEEGRYGVFPAKVYLRGFFLNYAKYLGLTNPSDLWEKFQNSGASTEPDEPKKASSALRLAPARADRLPVGVHSGLWERFVMWTIEGQNWILAYLVFPVILIGFFYGVHSYIQREAFRLAPEKALDVPRLLGMPASTRAGAAAPAANRAKEAAMTVEFFAKGEPSWMQIEADGKLAFQGILPALQKKGFRFRDSAKIRIGNPSSAGLRVNGRDWPLTPEELERTPLELELTSALIESKLGPLASEPPERPDNLR